MCRIDAGSDSARMRPFRLTLMLGISSLLVALVGSARAGMILTSDGQAAGFGLSTYASGFPNFPAGEGRNGGPFGVAFATNGNVLVSDLNGDIYVFPSDTDGQTVGGAGVTVGATYGSFDPLGMTQFGSNIYLGFQTSNKIDLINANGAAIQTLALHNALGNPITIAGPHGLAVAPNGDLLVSSDTGSSLTGEGIFDINPATGLTRQIVSTNSFDGITTDGTTVYAARADGEVLGFNISTGAQVFDSVNISGADGLTLGSGTLAGNLFVNTNFGQLIQVDLTTRLETVIGTNGSRGDFVLVDPTNGTLLLDQTDSILRLTAPPGGGFGAAPAPEPASLTLLSVGLAGMVAHGWRRRKLADRVSKRLD